MSFLLVKIGRSTANDIQINDERVGDKHIEIFRDVEGNVYLTDLQTENGTFVNDVAIDEAVQLQEKDTVKIANAFLFDWKSVLSKADENSFSVGTDASNKIRLNDSGIDPFHVQLYKDFKGNVFAHDLKSSHGTFINGHKIQGVALIKKGDRLKLGTTHYNWEDLFLFGRLTKVNVEQKKEAKIEEPVKEVTLPKLEVTENQKTSPKENNSRSTTLSDNTTPEKEEKPKMERWKKIAIIVVIDIILLVWLSSIL